MTDHRRRDADADIARMTFIATLVAIAFLLGFISGKASGAETIPTACQGYAKSDCAAVMEMR